MSGLRAVFAGPAGSEYDTPDEADAALAASVATYAGVERPSVFAVRRDHGLSAQHELDAVALKAVGWRWFFRGGCE